MKKIVLLISLLALVLCGCTGQQAEPEQKLYEATFLDVFDTVTVVKGPAESQDAFQKAAQEIHDNLEFYHRLFDIYEEYEGINNLRTINLQAGIAPVKVDSAIIEMLTDCREYCKATGGKVNAAMGSVLSIWHDAREDGLNDPANAYLPDENLLTEAAAHMDFDCVVIDEDASAVFITDPKVSLDVGAIAKGWAAQKVAEASPEGILLSVGGNACATGPKAKDTPWVIGVQDPDSEDFLHTVYLSRGSVVTSGDYQRAYTVNGTAYHHIIDPETLYPARYWRSVTVICEDSGTADALSTALFVLPLEEGLSLLEKYDACALWVDYEGNIEYSPGFKDLIRT